MNDVVTAAGETEIAGDAADLSLNPPAEIPAEPERPEWLDSRFKTPEDLAQSYSELEKKLKTKSEDLKTSLLGELEAEQAEGVPDDPAGYEIPEGVHYDPEKSGGLFETFSEWAHERQLSQDDFNELVSFYAETFSPNLEAEKERLGPDADDRLSSIARWAGANIPEEHFPALQNIMTTAENVQAIEAIMKLTVPTAQAGQTEVIAAPSQRTKGEIMELMATPQYTDPLRRNPEVVKEVDDWFAANAT